MSFFIASMTSVFVTSVFVANDVMTNTVAPALPVREVLSNVQFCTNYVIIGNYCWRIKYWSILNMDIGWKNPII